MDIYIKAKSKVSLIDKEFIKVSDIADVYADNKILGEVNNINLLRVNPEKEELYLITIIDIVKKISSVIPNSTINNVGANDVVIEYKPKVPKAKKYYDIIKIIVICLILITGASTAIMSFHSDAQMATVFENYYYIFFDKKIDNPMIINLPYSIGLAVGIIVFFNHFSGKKLTKDPTPIEIELSIYETNVADNIAETLDAQRKGKDSI